MRITNHANKKTPEGLTLQQEQIAIQLAAGFNAKTVAENFNIGAKTIHYWLNKSNAFRDRVAELGAESLRAARAHATSRCSEYVSKLEEIAFDEKERTGERIKALVFLISAAERSVEKDLARKVQLLEQAVYGDTALDVIAEEVQDAQQPRNEDR